MIEGKHPLEDETLDRTYVLEMMLWQMLSLTQDALIERNDPGGIDVSTIAKLQRRVMHWRENPDLYLQHPAWSAVKDTD